MDGIMAVPDAGTAPVGAVTWWRLSGTVEVTALYDAWAAAGLHDDLLPNAPSEQVALRRALEAYEGPHTKVVVLPKGAGYAVVDESFRPGEDGKPEPEYVTRFKAWLGENGVTTSKRDEVKALARKVVDAQLHLTVADMSAWLVKRAAAVDAIRLRDTGGIYFVPQAHRAMWLRIADVLTQVSSSRIYEIPALHTKNAVEAVLVMLQEEVDEALARIESEIDSGDLGARALNTRRAECEAKLVKLSSYEHLLGSRLDTLRESITALDARVVEAAIVAGG